MRADTVDDLGVDVGFVDGSEVDTDIVNDT